MRCAFAAEIRDLIEEEAVDIGRFFKLALALSYSKGDA